jgi:cytochrome c oxidase cbb3-type subunit III
MFSRLIIGSCLAACAVLAQEATERPEEKIAEKNPFETAADAALGRQYFLGHCASCHGPEGEGGRGINLTTGRYRMGSSDRELFRTIRRGIPGSEMPGNGLSETEVWRVITFVRRIGAQGAEEKAPGDSSAGGAVYEGKGACVQCHWINGRGGVLGPDLSEIGLRRSLKFLRESLTDPDKSIADDYRTYSVVTRSGERVRGIKLNEDDYTIQLRDSKENLRSFKKADLKEVKREPASTMAGYGTALTATELENLVAYLSSLRGKAK